MLDLEKGSKMLTFTLDSELTVDLKRISKIELELP
jgi:hypothetical protein